MTATTTRVRLYHVLTYLLRGWILVTTMEII